MGQMIEASLMKSAVVHDPLREHSFAAISYQWMRELFTLFLEKSLESRKKKDFFKIMSYTIDLDRFLRN